MPSSAELHQFAITFRNVSTRKISMHFMLARDVEHATKRAKIVYAQQHNGVVAQVVAVRKIPPLATGIGPDGRKYKVTTTIEELHAEPRQA